jgi:DNA replication licensing factor MCM4
MKVAIQEAATDPRTGQIDMDLITTGRSAASRQTMASMKKAIADLLEHSAPHGRVCAMKLMLLHTNSHHHLIIIILLLSF